MDLKTNWSISRDSVTFQIEIAMDDDRDFDDEFDDGGADEDMVGAGDLVDDHEDPSQTGESGADAAGESVAFIPSSAQQGLCSWNCICGSLANFILIHYVVKSRHFCIIRAVMSSYINLNVFLNNNSQFSKPNRNRLGIDGQILKNENSNEWAMFMENYKKMRLIQIIIRAERFVDVQLIWITFVSVSTDFTRNSAAFKLLKLDANLTE